MHPGNGVGHRRAGFTRRACTPNFDDKDELLLDLVRDLEVGFDTMAVGLLSEHVEEFV